MNNETGTGYRILIIISTILAILLFLGQTLSLLNYGLTVSLGLQESVEEVGKTGIIWAKGFAFGDTLIYLPLLLLGIIGLYKKRKWGYYFMFGSLAISTYWPIVHLYVIYIGRKSIQLNSDKYITFIIILSLITIYGLWGMWYLYKNNKKLIPCL